jgi:hypothetical protein
MDEYMHIIVTAKLIVEKSAQTGFRFSPVRFFVTRIMFDATNEHPSFQLTGRNLGQVFNPTGVLVYALKLHT